MPFLSLSRRWLVIAVGLVRAYLARGSYHGLYYSIEKPLKFFQTGALLEVSLEGGCWFSLTSQFVGPVSYSGWDVTGSHEVAEKTTFFERM